MPTRLAAGLALLLCLTGAAWGQEILPLTVVTLTPAMLTDAQGRELDRVPALAAWPLVQRQGERLELEPSVGARAWLPASAAAVLAGPPAFHQQRLARLGAAALPPALARRLAGGRIEEGDSQWLVEMAWGRPWRSSMVNRFQDEEHYVYRDRQGQSLLLRFKGGRLVPPLPAQLESPPPPR